MPKINESVRKEKEFGHCSACFELTTVDDPCCPMAGVLINGSYVRDNKKELDKRDEIISDLIIASRSALKLLRGSGFVESTKAIVVLKDAIANATSFGDGEE